MSVFVLSSAQFRALPSRYNIPQVVLLRVLQCVEREMGWCNLEIDQFVGNMMELDRNDEALANEVHLRRE